jgi:hypothetical protein
MVFWGRLQLAPILRATQIAPLVTSQAQQPEVWASFRSRTEVSGTARGRRHFRFCRHECGPATAGLRRKGDEGRSSARWRSASRRGPGLPESGHRPRIGSLPRAWGRWQADSAERPRPAAQRAADPASRIEMQTGPPTHRAPRRQRPERATRRPMPRRRGARIRGVRWQPAAFRPRARCLGSATGRVCRPSVPFGVRRPGRDWRRDAARKKTGSRTRLLNPSNTVN